MSATKNAFEKMDFETALTELETIVRALETGEVPLETTLAQFEKGVLLAKRCKELLDEAERKVKVLLPNGVSEDFE